MGTLLLFLHAAAVAIAGLSAAPSLPTPTSAERPAAAHAAARSLRVLGTSSNDTLVGGAGDDTLFAGAGAYDTVAPGDGDDTAYGQDGGDVIYASRGNDVSYGGNGRDDLVGKYGVDHLYGQGDADVLELYVGIQYADAGPGNDLVYLYADGYRDVVDCGAGDDTLLLVNGRDIRDRWRNCEHVRIMH